MFPRAAHALFWVAALGLLAVGWGLVTRQLSSPKPVTSTARPTAIIWDDRVFTNAHSLARWIRSRGGNFGRWADTHPAALAVVEHKAPETFRPPTTTVAAATPQQARKAAPASQARASAAGGSRIWGSIVEAFLLLAAMVAMAAGAIPVEVLQFRGITPPSASARAYLLGAGFATGTGVLAAIVLG